MNNHFCSHSEQHAYCKTYYIHGKRGQSVDYKPTCQITVIYYYYYYIITTTTTTTTIGFFLSNNWRRNRENLKTYKHITLHIWWTVYYHGRIVLDFKCGLLYSMSCCCLIVWVLYALRHLLFVVFQLIVLCFFNLSVLCLFLCYVCFSFHSVWSVFLYCFVYCFSPSIYLFIFYSCTILPTTATGWKPNCS